MATRSTSSRVIFVAPTVVKLRRACRGVVRHRGSFFQSAAILEVGGDPGRAKRVIADLCLNPGRPCAPADHSVGVRLGQGSRRPARPYLGRSFETAAPFGRSRVRNRQCRRGGKFRGCGGRAFRGACRPFRASGPKDGGSARKRLRPSLRATPRYARTNRPSVRSRRGRGGQ